MQKSPALDGWMGGWLDVEAGLRIANSNQKKSLNSLNHEIAKDFIKMIDPGSSKKNRLCKTRQIKGQGHFNGQSLIQNKRDCLKNQENIPRKEKVKSQLWQTLHGQQCHPGYQSQGRHHESNFKTV